MGKETEVFREDFLVKHVIRIEGGLVDDKDDPGGVTKFGICSRSYPGLDIRSLSIDQAIDIYTADYYEKPKLQGIEHPGAALMLLHCAVLHGNRGMCEIITRAANDFVIHPGIVAYNRLTIESWQTINDNMKQHPEITLGLIHGSWVRRFSLSIRKNQKLRKYQTGWTNRANEVFQDARNMPPDSLPKRLIMP